MDGSSNDLTGLLDTSILVDYLRGYEPARTWLKIQHGLGVTSMSARLKVPLYTANLKHFGPILGALAQKPY